MVMDRGGWSMNDDDDDDDDDDFDEFHLKG